MCLGKQVNSVASGVQYLTGGGLVKRTNADEDEDEIKIMRFTDGPSTAASGIAGPSGMTLPSGPIDFVVTSDADAAHRTPPVPCTADSVAKYRGDEVEERFASYTKSRMPCWWEFRERLRASDRASNHWRTAADVTEVADDTVQTELVALSLLHYGVYKGIAEALHHLEALNDALCDSDAESQTRRFTVLLCWKAMNSSLYTSFESARQLVGELFTRPGAKKARGSKIGEHRWKNTKSKLPPTLIDQFEKMNRALETRHQLDHRWPIWCQIDDGKFLIDRDHSASHVVLRPEVELGENPEAMQDGVAFSERLIDSTADGLNVVYEALLTGALDSYLSAVGCVVTAGDSKTSP